MKTKRWGTHEMVALAQQLDRPPYSQRLIDDVKAALEYSARLIDAADRLVAESSFATRKAGASDKGESNDE
jgi:hypothetical protein